MKLHTSYEDFLNEDVDMGRLGNTYLGQQDAEIKQHKEAGRPASMYTKQQGDHPGALAPQAQCVLDAFKRLDWQRIRWVQEMDDEQMVCFVVLPDDVQVELTAYNRMAQAAKETPRFGDWYGVSNCTTDGVRMLVDGPDMFHRSHFPGGGIPHPLRGVGVGVKLYRALLKHAGYIASNYTATSSAQRSWVSMVQNKLGPDGTPTAQHVLSFAAGNAVLAFDPAFDPAKAVDIVGRFIKLLEEHTDIHAYNHDVDPVLRKWIRDAGKEEILAPFEKAPALAERLHTTLASFLTEDVDFSRLGGTYLGTAHKQMQQQKQQAATAHAPAFAASTDPELVRNAAAKQEALDAFKALSWRALSFEKEPLDEDELKHYVVLPAPLRELLGALYKRLDRQVYGSWRGVGPNSPNDVFMTVDGTRDGELHRSHFPNGGIVKELRGLGLGPKIYRALLHEAGYLTSDDTAEDGARFSWISMARNKIGPGGGMTNDHVYSVVIGDNILAVDPAIGRDKAVKAATDFISWFAGHNDPGQDNYDIDPALKAIMLEDAYEYLRRFDPAVDAALKQRRAEKLAKQGSAA
jgi:ribosomal protein S18 acetylase RimI-like enzyme